MADRDFQTTLSRPKQGEHRAPAATQRQWKWKWIVSSLQVVVRVLRDTVHLKSTAERCDEVAMEMPRYAAYRTCRKMYRGVQCEWYALD